MVGVDGLLLEWYYNTHLNIFTFIQTNQYNNINHALHAIKTNFFFLNMLKGCPVFRKGKWYFRVRKDSPVAYMDEDTFHRVNGRRLGIYESFFS